MGTAAARSARRAGHSVVQSQGFYLDWEMEWDDLIFKPEREFGAFGTKTAEELNLGLEVS